MNKTAQDKKNLLFYPLGTVGRDMVYNLITGFLLTYIMFTRELTNEQLAAVTGIMVFARVFDALNDPIMGNIIEGTRTKWGKFKPWLLIGCISTGFVIFFTFNSSFQGWAFIIFFGIMYLAYSITYTMSDISYWGMVPALSSNADLRNQLTSRATLFAGIGGTAVSIFVPMLTTGEKAIGGNAITAYGVVALVIAVLTPLFGAFTLIGVKEKNVATDTAAKEKVSIKHIVEVFKNNDQLRWMALIFLIQEVGNGLIIGGLGATYIYFEFGYDGGLYSLFTTVGMAATALLMVFYPVISRKVSRKKLMTFMLVASLAGYALMLAAGLAFPESIKFYALTLGYMFGNFGNYCFYLVMMISIMNTVEYNEYKFGKREEGIITSLRPFITKMASALTVLITSGIYMIFRITSFTNQISAIEKEALKEAMDEATKSSRISDVLKGVTSGETNGLLLCIAILPAVHMIVAYFLYKKKYKLDEAEYERICKEIGQE
ncbi:MAG: glycoside-pentoside-hexuronide (GPH):cation symporter [Lachnospiraceae bacterium]|nr:glycoside-pentoside-hexuronide (GPH):cation symporter [Lachnospiraceae bacterium]